MTGCICSTFSSLRAADHVPEAAHRVCGHSAQATSTLIFGSYAHMDVGNSQWLARGSRRDRVAAKFVENEFEKVDRLMELYGRYGARVMAEERRLGTSNESYDDEEVLLARMDAGLYTLQQVGLVHRLCTRQHLSYAVITQACSARPLYQVE